MTSGAIIQAELDRLSKRALDACKTIKEVMKESNCQKDFRDNHSLALQKEWWEINRSVRTETALAELVEKELKPEGGPS